MATGLLPAFSCCGRGPTPARSRGAPPPREDRASGPVLLSGNRPEAGRASARSAWGWGPKREQEMQTQPANTMKLTNISGIVAAVLVLLLAVPRAQEPQRAAGTVKEGVTAVLVDVVVRDKRGQPVRDLTEADFEVFEDGVAQKIGSFT